MMRPQATRQSGARRPSALPPAGALGRYQILGGGKPTPSVEHPLAPLGVRRMAFAVAVLLLVAAFCLGLWATLWLLDAGLFIVALAGLCALLLAGGVVEKHRNK